MPKLYEYFGLDVLFYSNEHEPIHVHGIDPDGCELRAEIIVKNGKIVRIRYLATGNRPPLTGRSLKDFSARSRQGGRHREKVGRFFRPEKAGQNRAHYQTPRMSTPTQHYISITKAEYVDGLRLRIAFDDGVERVVDFEPFLAKSLHPDIRKYCDKRRFKKFSVDRGHLHWNDYDLIFPMADLYAGHIS